MNNRQLAQKHNEVRDWFGGVGMNNPCHMALLRAQQRLAVAPNGFQDNQYMMLQREADRICRERDLADMNNGNNDLNNDIRFAFSMKRKSSAKKSPKRKSPKRKSPKRKSPKRKSPKRKSPKRKSPKRKI